MEFLENVLTFLLTFSWIKYIIITIVLETITIYMMIHDRDPKPSLSTEGYAFIIFLCLIPMLNLVVLVSYTFTGLFMLFTAIAYLLKEIGQNKLEEKEVNDIQKYHRLCRNLISAGIFKSNKHIDDFIDSMDVADKLSNY